MKRCKMIVAFLAVAVGFAWPAPAAGVLQNGGFESPVIGAPGYAYTTTFGTLDPNTGVPSWTLTSSSSGHYAGLLTAAFASTWGLHATNGQAAFIEYAGWLSQTITNCDAGSFTVSFQAEVRPGNLLPVQVTLDSTVLMFTPYGSMVVTPTNGLMQTFTSIPIDVTAGTHTLTFTGVVDYDQIAIIDDVSVVNSSQPVSPVPAVLNGDFQRPAWGGSAGEWYTPTHGALATNGVPYWAFGPSTAPGYVGLCQQNGGGSGTWGVKVFENQGAFLEGTGWFSQTITNFPAGSVQVNFYASGPTHASLVVNPVQVKFDNTVLTFGGPTNTTVSPPVAVTTLYTSDAIRVAPGSHTLKFSGTVGGAAPLSSIDNVWIAYTPPARGTIICVR